MCYKAYFYNGGHRRKKADTLVIFARAYKDGKKEGAHTKTADEKQEKTEKRKANLQTCSISTHTKKQNYHLRQERNQRQ